jgi:hypothetical protein
MKTIVTMQEIKNKARGGWFNPSNTRFFNSRYPQAGYMVGDKMYFISSEQFEREPRMYTIRVVDIKTGDVDTIGEFNVMSRSQAQTKLNRILKEVVNV